MFWFSRSGRDSWCRRFNPSRGSWGDDGFSYNGFSNNRSSNSGFSYGRRRCHCLNDGLSDNRLGHFWRKDGRRGRNDRSRHRRGLRGFRLWLHNSRLRLDNSNRRGHSGFGGCILLGNNLLARLEFLWLFRTC
jgi:hypothetical protein